MTPKPHALCGYRRQPGTRRHACNCGSDIPRPATVASCGRPGAQRRPQLASLLVLRHCGGDMLPIAMSSTFPPNAVLPAGSLSSARRRSDLARTQSLATCHASSTRTARMIRE